jgi:Protein of unknown function (DUF1573)
MRCICLFAACVLFLGGACDKSQPSGSPPASSNLPAVAPNSAPQTAPPAESKSQIEVKGPNPKWKAEILVHDFGTVWAGDMLTFPFRISNEGGSILKILEAKPRCSCSVAENYSKEIPSGQSGVIPFKLNTAGKKGDVDEYLTIKTNDPEKAELTLHMKGYVRQLVETEVISDSLSEKAPDPKVALDKIKHSAGSFGTIKGTERLQRVIKLKNTSGEPSLILKIDHVQSEGKQFTAELQETAPGQEYALTIVGDPPFPPGQVMATVALETSIPGRPIYNIGIYAYVPNRIDVQPPKIVVDPAYPFIRERLITISNYGSTPIEVTGVAATDPNYKMNIVRPTKEAPNQWRIMITLPDEGYRPPPFGEQIRIETNDAETKTIDLEVLPYLDRPATVRPADKPMKWYPGKV